MARINVDDNIETRPQYRKLLKLVQYDDDKALGMLVRFWRTAQTHWGRYELVPFEEIEMGGFELILESGWGIKKEDGIYAIDSEERFAWYRQSIENGKKGGRPKKNNPPPKTPPTTPKTNNPAVTQNNPAVTQREPSVNPLVPVLSLAPVISLSLLKNDDKKKIEDWESVKAELLQIYPNDTQRLEGAFKQIEKEGYAARQIGNVSAWIRKAWRDVRHEYAHHDAKRVKQAAVEEVELVSPEVAEHNARLIREQIEASLKTVHG
jgi:hypothetical protein